MASVKMSPKALIIPKGKDAFRPISDKLVEEYALVLKAAGEKWPFPNTEHDGIKVMPATKEVKDKKSGEVTIEETGDFVVLSGVHRVSAAVAAKWGEVPVWVIRPQTAVEILRAGIRANVEHGKRFSTAERDKLMFRCKEQGMSQDDIADLFDVHKSTVSRVLSGQQSADSSEKHARGGKAKKGKKKGKGKSKNGRTLSPEDFVTAVRDMREFAEAHHDSIISYAAGALDAQSVMQDAASYLIRLAEGARTVQLNRAAEAAPTV